MGRIRGWIRKVLGLTEPVPTKGIPQPYPAPPGPSVVRRSLDEALLRFLGARDTAPTDVVVGLDFGTSCSKVIIQAPYLAGGRAVAIPFPELGHPACRYLLPTRIFVRSNGEASLWARDDADGIAHLKVGLLDGANGRAAPDPVVYSAAYLGLVLREARRWFLSTQEESFGRVSLRWSLNVGIPSAGYDDEETRSTFQALAEAAWCVSEEGDSVTLERTKKHVDAAKERGTASEIDIAVVPEVAAQVVGYAKSRQREDGLHILIDLGASTLDICSFLLRTDRGDDIYTLLTAEVARLGLYELHLRRMSTAGRRLSGPDAADPIAPIPEWPSDSEALSRALSNCDEQFLRECRQAVCRSVKDLYIRRDPNSGRWRHGLPVFSCGGGAKASLFERLVTGANSDCTKAWSIHGLAVRSLPVPERILKGEPRMNEAVFGRLGVAYGLSHPKINIGEIEPPGIIPDVILARRTRPWTEQFVDKDQV